MRATLSPPSSACGRTGFRVEVEAERAAWHAAACAAGALLPDWVFPPDAFDVTVAPGEGVQAAVNSCPPGGSVLLLPGTHEGTLVLPADKEVHVFGRGQATLRTWSGDVLYSRAATSTIEGLAMWQVGFRNDERGVKIEGGQLRLQACDIRSAYGICMMIKGGADPLIASCRRAPESAACDFESRGDRGLGGNSQLCPAVPPFLTPPPLHLGRGVRPKCPHWGGFRGLGDDSYFCPSNLVRQQKGRGGAGHPRALLPSLRPAPANFRENFTFKGAGEEGLPLTPPNPPPCVRLFGWPREKGRPTSPLPPSPTPAATFATHAPPLSPPRAAAGSTAGRTAG